MAQRHNKGGGWWVAGLVAAAMTVTGSPGGAAASRDGGTANDPPEVTVRLTARVQAQLTLTVVARQLSPVAEQIFALRTTLRAQLSGQRLPAAVRVSGPRDAEGTTRLLRRTAQGWRPLALETPLERVGNGRHELTLTVYFASPSSEEAERMAERIQYSLQRAA